MALKSSCVDVLESPNKKKAKETVRLNVINVDIWMMGELVSTVSVK